MTPTITKQASEKIAKLGISLKTENYYCSDVGEITFSEDCKPFKKAICGKHLPLPNLQELFLALEEIGEKLGMRKAGNHCVSGDGCVENEGAMHEGICAWKYYETEWKETAHRLTDIFLENGMEGVSEEIINLISKKG